MSTTPAPPLLGDLRDIGAARRDTVNALSYTAMGTVKILSDLVATRGDVQGFANIGGQLRTDLFHSEGVLAIAGDVSVKGQLRVHGTTELGGKLTAGELNAVGRLRVSGPIVVDGPFHLDGQLEAGSSLTAHSLSFKGGLHVEGLLETPTIVGQLTRPSRAGTIRSRHVRIVRAPLFLGRNGRLIVDRIEAEEVDLAGVDCEYLRAERIRLGPDAHVTHLEGTVIRQHSSAKVGPVSWEPPPFGMSR